MTTHDHAPNHLPKQATSPRRRQVLAAAILATCALSSARANTDTWIGPSGNWSTGSNWSLGTPPVTGDTASLTQSDATNRSVTLSASTPSLAGLIIDSTGVGYLGLSQSHSAANLAVGSGDEYIGYSGFGAYNDDGGTNSVANGHNLYVGYNAGSSGRFEVWGNSTYDVSGTILTTTPATATITGNQYVGYRGTGTFTLGSHGTVTSSNLFLAYAPGSMGSYTLYGSSLAASTINAKTGNAYIGGSNTAPGGTATLSLTSGTLAATGSLKVWNTPGTLVRLGDANTAADVTLSVGSLDLSGNPALLSWSRGTLAVTGSAGLDASVLGPSTDLSGGSNPKTLSVIKTLAIPASTSLTLSGGTISAGSLSIQPGGTAVLNAGSLSAGSLNTGGDPTRLAWTAGTLAITGPAGLDAAALGPARTIAAGQTLAVTNALSIPASTGLTVSGGTLSANSLSVQPNGTLTLSGGTVSTGSFDTAGDPARLAWTAGTLAITGPAGLDAAALGPARTIAAGQTLAITNALSIPAGTPFTLSGGAISAGTISNGNDPSRLVWTSGSLSVTGYAGLNLSSLSPALDFPADKSLSVSSTAMLLTGATLNLSGGSLSADTLIADGTVDLPSGGLYLNTLRLGNATGTSGALSISGSTSGTAFHAGNQYVGYSGTGSVTQSGSKNSIAQGSSLILGFNAGSSGSYSLSGLGTLAASSEVIGSAGAASFSQTGGTNSASTLTLASQTGSSATYALSGGSLNSSSTYIGGSSTASGGSGTFSITGGTFTSTYPVKIWNDSSRLSIAGGYVQLPSLDINPNRFSWTGGTLSVTGSAGVTLSSGNLTIGPTQHLSDSSSLVLSANSTLTLSGGSLLVGTAAYIATSGSASIVQSAGSNILYVPGGALYLAYGANTTGTYSLSGSGSLTSYGNQFVGDAGTGKFFQSGGTNSISNAYLYLASSTGSTGSYSLSGGLLALNGVCGEYVGYSGDATFTQTGGTNSFSTGNTLCIGLNAGSTGTYSLAGSSSLLKLTPSEYVGYSGRGNFVQTGGTHSLTYGPLLIGYNPGSFGTYSLSGTGLLSVGGNEIVGSSGTGSFSQSGGTNTLSRSLIIGSDVGTSGSYALSGGSASALSVCVGGTASSPGGTGALSISSGSLSVTGDLKIWDTADTSVALSGGFLSIAALNTSGNSARFAWTGGTLFLAKSHLSISPAGPLGPSLTLSPNMTLRTTALPYIAPAASLDISGGSLVVAYTGPSPADLLRADLQAGLISSSAAAAADPQHPRALGYTDVASTLTVLLTLPGDANLDGAVNPDDYALLDRSYARATTNAHWSDGDFNYDGAVDASDYLLIDTTLGQAQHGFSPDFLSQRESQFGPQYVSTLLASVPEPSSLASLLLLRPLTRRRRRTLKIRRTFQ